MQVGSTALSVSEEQHGSHESNLNYRMKEIEAQNRQQKEEIVSLKIAAVRDRKFINELSGRVASLEVLGRRKRLYRLVPSNVIHEKKTIKPVDDDQENQQIKFYGPATNCNELGKIGHTLNGYYLVNSNGKDQPNIKNVQVVYCRFQNPEGTKQSKNYVAFKYKNVDFVTKLTFRSKSLYNFSVCVEIFTKLDIETLIGNELQLKRKKSLVHFHVEKTYDSNANNFIYFKNERLNIGQAYNMKNGDFTAPVAGVYHFEFTGLKDNEEGDLYVFLYVNRGNTEGAVAYADKHAMYLTLSFSTSLPLKAGDTVSLFKSGPNKLYDELGKNTYTYFTGWLEGEDD